MEDHTKKKQIKREILEELPKLGKQFKSGWLVEAVTRKVGFMCYPDTILRYLRELRAEGKVSYRCVNKPKMIYEIEN